MKTGKMIVLCFVAVFIFASFGVMGQNRPNAKMVDGDLTFTVKGVSFVMKPVEGGTFQMGCANKWSDCYSNEKPLHSVTLIDFWIGETEVTQSLWKAVMGTTISQQRDKDNPYSPLYGEGSSYPIYYVSWNDAVDFCNKLNAIVAGQLPNGYHFALPTEAEWEYAARGGKHHSDYMYSGGNNLDDVAWCLENSDELTHPVKGKTPNAIGLYDMTGNVCEWCADWYDYYQKSPSTEPVGPDSAMFRVVRGGCWGDNAKSCRVANRDYKNPSMYYIVGGIRLALVNPEMSESAAVAAIMEAEAEAEALRNAIEEFSRRPAVVTSVPESERRNYTYVVNEVDFKIVYVEGGLFTMGCSSEQGDNCDSVAMPSHSVTVSSFWMGETEVTQALWQAVMGTTVSEQRDKAASSDELGIFRYNLYGEGSTYPMYYVSWEDCVLFCIKLNSLLAGQLPEGYRFALPTEAEWEYAARGGKHHSGYMYSGGDNIDDVAWCLENSDKLTHPVKGKAPNAIGLYDMTGNVCEMCMDLYNEDYYGKSPAINPQGPTNGSERVMRGGTVNNYAKNCKISKRMSISPNFCYNGHGFRLALVHQ